MHKFAGGVMKNRYGGYRFARFIHFQSVFRKQREGRKQRLQTGTNSIKKKKKKVLFHDKLFPLLHSRERIM